MEVLNGISVMIWNIYALFCNMPFIINSESLDTFEPPDNPGIYLNDLLQTVVWTVISWENCKWIKHIDFYYHINGLDNRIVLEDAFYTHQYWDEIVRLKLQLTQLCEYLTTHYTWVSKFVQLNIGNNLRIMPPTEEQRVHADICYGPKIKSLFN